MMPSFLKDGIKSLKKSVAFPTGPPALSWIRNTLGNRIVKYVKLKLIIKIQDVQGVSGK